MKDAGPSCNRCGACCARGGSCIYRHWDQNHLPFKERRPWDFEGRCELLADLPDGSTVCTILERVRPEELKGYVNGVCDFPQWRRIPLPVVKL